MRLVYRFKYILLFLTFFPNFLHSQDWVDRMRNPDADFREAQKSFDDAWADRAYEKGNGYKQFKRWENFITPRMDKSGRYDATKSWARFARYRTGLGPNFRVAGSWTQLGPFAPPGGYNSNGIGRLDCIAFHPTDANTYWVGTPSGGLWQTKNNGQSWHTISDGWEGLGISDIVIDQKNPNIMYVATGDRDHYAVHSFGILKSIDGGNTWSPSGLTSLSRIFKLLIDPDDSDILLAATCCGLYRTTNGGLTWTLIETIPDHQIFDIAFRPGDNNMVYAVAYDADYDHDIGQYVRTFGFYRSLNNGRTFESLPIPFPMEETNRIEIGVSADDPDKVYLYCSDAQTSSFYGLFKSTESGLNFKKIADPADPVIHPENPATKLTINDVLLYQGWYDWTMQVNPLDANEIYLGAVGMIRTYDGGDTWEYVAGYNSGAGAIHTDFHAIEYHPITNKVYVGCDGGMWREPDVGLEWTPLNDSLVATQNYTFSSSLMGDNILIGNQDNSTFYYNGEEWDIISGGDGTGCLIDPAVPEVLYSSSQLGYLYKIDHGEFQSMLSPERTNQPSRWESVIRMNTVFRNELYALYQDVWKSEDAGVTWKNISNGKMGSPYYVMEQLEIAESNSDYIYTADNYEVYRTADGGETWTNLPRPWDQYEGVGDLEIDPTNPDRIWVCTWSGRVFQTDNGGAKWTDISGSLPAIKANNIIYQKGANAGLYLAMDVGVFYKDKTMSDWLPFYTNLPNVVVTDLEIIYCTGTLRAATYGRGVWETELLNFDPSEVCCNSEIATLSTTGALLECGVASYRITASTPKDGSTYQWYQNGRPIAGATAASYDAVESGVYTVRYMNGTCSSFASDPLVLTLLPNGICTQTCADMNENTASGPGNPTIVNIVDDLHSPDAEELIWICVSTEGDLGTEEELMNIYDESDNLLGQTIFGRDCSGLSPEACFYLSSDDFKNWISDGILTVKLDPINTEIGLFCERNQVCVGLRYSTTAVIGCVDDLAVPTTRDGVTYEAGKTLNSVALVGTEQNVVFTAGKYIDLEPGFDAGGGSIIDIYIAPCTDNLASNEDPNRNCGGDLAVPIIENGIEDYQAGDKLYSDIIIESGQSVTFTAGESITLQPGFTVKPGADFHAYISDCLSGIAPEITHPRPNALLDNGCEEQVEQRIWHFEWTAIPDATTYQFRVYAANDATPSIEKELRTAQFTLQDFDFIATTNTQDWEAIVRAKVEGVWSDWSQALPFHVEAVNTDCPKAVAARNGTISEQQETVATIPYYPTLNKELRLMVHPNPATTFVNINYFIHKVITLEIDLYDMTGRRIQQIRPLKAMDPGEHSIALNTMDLEAGMYFIVLNNRDFRMTEKLVVIR